MPKKDKSKKNSVKTVEKRPLLLKMDGTIYGQVTKTLGDCNFTVFCFDGTERLCHIRKSIKKQIVSVDSIVLVGLRDFQDNKGDIIYVYQKEEVYELKKRKEIPDTSNVNNNTDIDMDADETGFDFDAI